MQLRIHKGKDATSRTGIGLLGLSVDIHETIIDQLLLDVPEPLFVPIYNGANHDIGDDGDLENKCIENYGNRDEHQLEAAQAILNWSSTCRHFRKLLAARIFKSVVLRSRPKSVASIKALRETPHWAQIESFIFAATEHEYTEAGKIVKGEFGSDTDDDDDGDHEEEDSEHENGGDEIEESQIPSALVSKNQNDEEKKDESNSAKITDDVEKAEKATKTKIAFTNINKGGKAKYSLEVEMSDLRSIISDLPPNVKSVTLDFPNGWRYEWGQSIMDGGIYHQSDPEEGLRYRGQIHTAIEALSLNDINAKSEFELKLLSIPPIYCAAYESESWHKFLAKITAFTLAFCHWDNGAGWNMNVYAQDSDVMVITKKLPNFFLNHLESVKRLHVYGDSSWPLGLSPCEMNQVEVELPKDARLLPNLEHVSFKEFFICETLQDFLLRQILKLKTIDLTNCFAAGEYSPQEDDTPQEPNWVTFFRAIADANPKKLEQLIVNNASRSLEDLVGGNRDYDRKKDDDPEIVARKEALDTWEKQEANKSQLTNPARSRQLLAHVSVDDKYGMIFDSEEVNVSVFNRGDAHREWLRLVDTMEANEKRLSETNDSEPAT